MQRVLTIKLLLDTPRDEDRVAHQVESLFDFGTIKECVAEGLNLAEDPRLLSVAVGPAVDERCR
jgi:hypothetical protein